MAEKMRPLYQQIHEALLTGILNGSWKPGDQLPSEKELSEQYKVSRITSKRALDLLAEKGYSGRSQGKGSFVLWNGSTAGKGLPANSTSSGAGKGLPAGSTGSGAGKGFPACSARAGKGSRPQLIGLILPDFDETYGAGLLASVENYAAENGVFLILRRSYDDQAQEERSIEEVMLLGVDGLLLQPVHGAHYSPKILQLVLDRFPLVFIDRHLRGLNASFVGTDNTDATKKATDYLFDLGHRCIGFLTPPHANTTAIEDRLEGFARSHSEHGLPFDPTLWLRDLTATLPGRDQPDNISADILSIQNLLQNRPDITCLFAAEYNIALMAARAVQALGLRVPEDISILCFDSPRNFMQEYSFTHLKQREAVMGKTAVQLLLNQIRQGPGAAVKEFCEADLVVGLSTLNKTL